MDFKVDPALEAFRDEVRGFLSKHLPADLVCLAPRPSAAGPHIRRWQKILTDKGWGAPYWATQHGGTGWTIEQQLVFDEECVAAGAPALDTFAHRLLGPALNEFATRAQRLEHLGSTLAGERLWCQGFSEPGAGSDLASLRTRAERDRDHYVIRGQKTWTSYGHRADWIFLLARTGRDDARKQAGIGFFLVDMKTPGIAVRPIRSIDGRHHMNETFFDDVRVPATNLIGGEGAGWNITKFLLNNEHATTADLPLLRLYLRHIERLIVEGECGVSHLMDHPDYALHFARFRAEVEAVAMMVRRTAALESQGNARSHAMGSMLKLRGTDLQQRMSAFLVELLGDRGAIEYPEHPDAEADRPAAVDVNESLAAEMFFRRASTIFGGTSEVQRGIVARHLFGY